MGYHFRVYETVKSKAESTTLIPIIPGRYLICTDTSDVYYDNKDRIRKRLSDIVDLNTDTERAAIIAPLDKFYYVKETAHLWRYQDSKWVDLTAVAEPVSKSVALTLTAAGWSSQKQTLSITGLGATQNGTLGLAQGITETQMQAAAQAGLYIDSQSEGKIVIGAKWTVPSCDIPITLILLD